MKGIVALGFAALVGCAHTEEQHATVGFAITTASDAESAHVLARKVNAMQPIDVGVDGADVTITYATRGREGVTLHVDPSTFAVHASDRYEYAEQASRRRARCLEQQTAYRGELPGVAVVGVPHVVESADGKTIVAFFLADEDGISLVAKRVR